MKVHQQQDKNEDHQSSDDKKKKKEGVATKVFEGITRTGENAKQAISNLPLKKLGVKQQAEKRTSEHGEKEQEQHSDFFERMETAVTKATKVVVDPMTDFFAQKCTGRATRNDAANEAEEGNVPSVPPDSVLQQMKLIANKRVKGVSVKDFYDTVFSEGNNDSDKGPLFGPWLETCGKENVKVGDWEMDDGGYVGNWCRETYPQKRTVTFVFNKNIPFSGPTVASVTQTHHCRLEDDDDSKCVVQMTIQMANIPYSDCFNVEVRWVVTAVGTNEIVVQIGLLINFVKSCIVSGKIRSSATAETTQSQLNLLDTALQSCGATAEEVEEEEEEEGEEAGCWAWLVQLWSLVAFWDKPLANRKDRVAVEAKRAEVRLKHVLVLLDKHGPPKDDEDDVDSETVSELKSVNASLDKILKSCTKEKTS